MSRQRPHSRRLDLANAVEWAHPLNRGRVAWWLGVDGAGGRLTDLCHVASLDGSLQPLTGGPAWATPRGGAFKDLTLGGSTYVNFGTALPALDFGTNPYTFGGWITVAAGFTSGGSFPFCRRSPTTSGNPGYEFLYGASNSMGVRANGGAVSWTTAINDGVRRRYIATVVPGGSTTLYVNGRAVVSGSTGAGSASQTDTATQLGARNGVPGFQGGVGDFGIWGRALSAAEVALEFDHASRGYSGQDSPARWQRGRAWSCGFQVAVSRRTISGRVGSRGMAR